MSEWKHRTQSGRVVYDREPHKFLYRDSARILRTQIDEKHIQDPLNVFWCVTWASQNLSARVFDLAWDLVDAAAAAGGAPELGRALIDAIGALVDLSRAWISRYGFPRGKPRRWFWTIAQLQEYAEEWLAEQQDPTSNQYLNALTSIYETSRVYLEEEGIIGKAKP